MDVNVISIGIQTVVEYQWSIHEAARVYKTSSFTNLHLFHIEHEAAIEDMESGRALATEEKDLIVSDLVSETHVGGHPLRFVDLWCINLLPDITRNVVNFNSIDDALLINPSSEGEDIIVLEDTKTGASARHAHISDQLPLVFLSIVDFTVTVDLVAHKSANHINEVLDGTN